MDKKEIKRAIEFFEIETKLRIHRDELKRFIEQFEKHVEVIFPPHTSDQMRGHLQYSISNYKDFLIYLSSIIEMIGKQYDKKLFVNVKPENVSCHFDFEKILLSTVFLELMNEMCKKTILKMQDIIDPQLEEKKDIVFLETLNENLSKNVSEIYPCTKMLDEAINGVKCSLEAIINIMGENLSLYADAFK